ncbi:hypothetical protein AB1Y20_003367 [Prymnesium parvum]|uniref:SET domain-containing protein n=1 Tax=Prymnesium parvum TaxID=97485 RepID=A0AB34JDD3_PRYPA
MDTTPDVLTSLTDPNAALIDALWAAWRWARRRAVEGPPQPVPGADGWQIFWKKRMGFAKTGDNYFLTPAGNKIASVKGATRWLQMQSQREVRQGDAFVTAATKFDLHGRAILEDPNGNHVCVVRKRIQRPVTPSHEGVRAQLTMAADGRVQLLLALSSARLTRQRQAAALSHLRDDARAVSNVQLSAYISVASGGRVRLKIRVNRRRCIAERPATENEQRQFTTPPTVGSRVRVAGHEYTVVDARTLLVDLFWFETHHLVDLKDARKKKTTLGQAEVEQQRLRPTSSDAPLAKTDWHILSLESYELIALPLGASVDERAVEPVKRVRRRRAKAKDGRDESRKRRRLGKKASPSPPAAEGREGVLLPPSPPYSPPEAKGRDGVPPPPSPPNSPPAAEGRKGVSAPPSPPRSPSEAKEREVVPPLLSPPCSPPWEGRDGVPLPRQSSPQNAALPPGARKRHAEVVASAAARKQRMLAHLGGLYGVTCGRSRGGTGQLVAAVRAADSTRLSAALRHTDDIALLQAVREHSLLHLAVTAPSLLEILLERTRCAGALSFIDERDGKGHTPLSAACAAAAANSEDPLVRSVELLLREGADTTLPVRNGRSTALLEACAQPTAPGRLCLLLDAGVALEQRSLVGGWTALQTSAEHGNLHAVELLLRRGAGVNVVDHEGRSALHWACNAGKHESVSMLLRWGADQQILTANQETAYQLARRSPKCLNLLLGVRDLAPPPLLRCSSLPETGSEDKVEKEDEEEGKEEDEDDEEDDEDEVEDDGGEDEELVDLEVIIDAEEASSPEYVNNETTAMPPCFCGFDAPAEDAMACATCGRQCHVQCALSCIPAKTKAAFTCPPCVKAAAVSMRRRWWGLASLGDRLEALCLWCGQTDFRQLPLPDISRLLQGADGHIPSDDDILRVLPIALWKDDVQLFVFLLSATSSPPLDTEAHLLDLLHQAVEHNAAGCALVLCNRLGRSQPQPACMNMLIRRALQCVPPHERVARALLIYVHRTRSSLQHLERSVSEEGASAADRPNLAGTLSQWPQLPIKQRVSDVTGLVELYGDDLSDGVEAVPVRWCNAVDDALPPPMVYLRHSIPGHAVATPQFLQRAPSRCRGDGLHTGAPDRVRVECNYMCGRTSPKLRQVQRGVARKLEVYRVNETVGWGLRTLEDIRKGEFIMEYVGELCNSHEAELRVLENPKADVYMMHLKAGEQAFCLDALSVRNASAFANFSCLYSRGNMEKRACLTNHWDSRLPHAGFFALRNICAGEKLTYRRDEGVTTVRQAGWTKVSAATDTANRCQCGHSGCIGWL